MADSGLMPVSRLRRLLPVGVLIAACGPLASFSHAPTVPPGSPDPLLRLKAGNERFVHAVASDGRLTMTATPAAAPVAAVLSCAEQRVAPEVVFAAAPGEIVTVRSLGEAVDRAVVGSVEHSVEAGHVPLVVVLGHDECAAVRAAVDPHATALGAHLNYLIQSIRAGLPRAAADQRDVRRAVLANVEQVINDLLGASPALRTAVQQRRLDVVGAYFDGSTGQVVFSEPVGLVPSRW